MHRTKLLIISLIIFALFPRLWFFFNVDNSAGAEKITKAVSIIDNPRLGPNFDGNTSVFYNYLLVAWLRVWPDIEIAPRVLSMVFGILAIIPFYFLVRLIFTENIAFYSSVLAALFPLHAMQSTFSMSDTLYHFFFLACLYFIFKFKLKERRMVWVVLAGVLFNAAALLRFESWSLIIILFVLLLREGKKYSIVFLSLSLISPCAWMLLCHHFHKDALISFTLPARTAYVEIVMRKSAHNRSILGWLSILRMMLGYIIVLSGLFGIAYSFLKKRSLYFGLFFLYFYVLYTINTLSLRMWHNERYAIVLGLLMLPYSVVFLERLSVFLKSRLIILFLPFLVISCIEFNHTAHRYINWNTLPVQIKELSFWIRENIPSSSKILIGLNNNDLYGHDIILRSSIPLRNFFLVTIFSPAPSLNKSDIENYVVREKPDFLILNSQGYLNSILDFDADANEIKEFGSIFKRVYFKDAPDSDRFNIYKIYY